jgi:hypothetical protein
MGEGVFVIVDTHRAQVAATVRADYMTDRTALLRNWLASQGLTPEAKYHDRAMKRYRVDWSPVSQYEGGIDQALVPYSERKA